jgi:hypothetical protein
MTNREKMLVSIAIDAAKSCLKMYDPMSDRVNYRFSDPLDLYTCKRPHNGVATGH